MEKAKRNKSLPSPSETMVILNFRGRSPDSEKETMFPGKAFPPNGSGVNSALIVQ
jgi:hypothetical protein